MTQWRAPFPKFGSMPNFARVAEIAQNLGVSLAAFGASGAAIVGSNGKGSTAAMTAALLQQTGLGVGLFTSPHLLVLNERFRFDGRDIDDQALGHHWKRVLHAAGNYLRGSGEQMGAFEFLFLIAADWFAACGATHTIWEAGIGGRHDPVRLIEARRVALTSLDLEHTELLGETLEEIACDKLDAAPRGGKAFVAADCLAYRGIIEAHCGARNVEVVFIDERPLGGLRAPLAGDHQRSNAALAVALAHDMARLSHTQIRDGFANTRWPGRLEVLATAPLIVIDVCHTPGAARAARQGFAAMRGKGAATLVCGVSENKNGDGIIGALAPGFERIICTQAHHNGLRSAAVAALAKQANPAAEIVATESVAGAYSMLSQCAESAAILVAGGLFLAAEFRALHLGLDPAQLSQR